MTTHLTIYQYDFFRLHSRNCLLEFMGEQHIPRSNASAPGGCESAGKFQLHGCFSGHSDAARQEAGIGQSFDEFHVNLEGVTRSDHLSKFDIVQARGHRHTARCRSHCTLPGDQNGSGLQGCLTQQHARQHRLSGIMTAEYIEIRGDKLAPGEAILGFVNDFVDPQKWIAMRNQPADLFS
jgi:hypothetical protein